MQPFCLVLGDENFRDFVLVAVVVFSGVYLESLVEWGACGVSVLASCSGIGLCMKCRTVFFGGRK
jgi:hypothetical protein